ncbi:MULTISPECIES: hypothetical protein [unclassified Marinimicrobium]|uniref:hypothetical protein n=1 Tax=unclassified Marinimicrobium TaxID=2632100 RepID=UPI000C677590|nr:MULTISPECIES: hypothetical protein [unclassified Marinimicrobium]MAN51399.1 hypothetical protein [Marinimicrobium sp.]
MNTRTPLILLLLMPFVAHSAELMYRQGFETPIEDNPEIQWETHGYELTQAIVDYMPHEGEKSVRGNFNPEVIDPVTNMKGEPFVQLKLNFKDIPALDGWYETTDKIYVSWWFKHDACFWKGPDFENDDPLRTTGKFAFLRMNEDPSSSYYFTMNGGKDGVGALSANKWNDLWQEWYGRPSLWLRNNQSWGSDGLWHKISFFIGKNEEGHKYLMWWIDDKLMQSDRFEADGKHRIFDGFTLDSIQFWHSFWKNTSESIEAEGAGVCNGWQIDDIQIWDDIPARPLPPRAS